MNCLHNFIFTALSSLKQIQDKTACIFKAVKFVGIWQMLTSQVEGNKHACTWTGLQLAFLPLSPMAASETSRLQKFSQSIHQKTDALDALD